MNKTVVGTIGSASIMGYMLSPILAGWLSDRFGRKEAILLGIFGFSGLTVLCGLANYPSQLFAARFFTGVAEAFFFIPMLAYTLELFPERPGFFLTLMSSGSSLGWFVGPALAGWLLNTTGNWRSPFWAAGVLGLVLSGLLYLLLAQAGNQEIFQRLFEKGTVQIGPYRDADLIGPGGGLPDLGPNSDSPCGTRLFWN